MPPNRFDQRREQTRQQLLEAGEHVFSEKGYHAASILDITEAADVSKRTFYLHFKDKEDLIEHLALKSFEEVRLKIENDKAHALDDPREIHRHVVRTIFDYLDNNREMLHLIAGEDGSHRLNALARTYIAQAMVLGFNDPEVCVFRKDAPVPIDVLGNGIGGMIFQLICWWAANSDRYTPEEMAEMAVLITYDGIGINFEITNKEEAPAGD